MQETQFETDAFLKLLTDALRAGPEFTRKVMRQIDDEAAGATKGIQSTTLITLLAAVGIVGVIVIIAVILLRGGNPTPTAQDLAATPFTTTVISSDLAQGIPIEWRTFGVEPVLPNMG